MSQLAPYLYQEDLYRFPASTVVIIPREWSQILEEEKTLLAKILGSVRISLASVVILSRQNVTVEALGVHNPSKVLVFGADLQPEIKAYELVKMDGVSIIKADDLARLDDARKKSLWQALRQMFGV